MIALHALDWDCCVSLVLWRLARKGFFVKALHLPLYSRLSDFWIGFLFCDLHRPAVPYRKPVYASRASLD